jgi:integrase
MLQQHRKDQLELRLRLGMGKHDADSLVFCNEQDASPISPNYLSIMWIRALAPTGIKVTFHALRHTHASALLAAGKDVVKISRRLGHSSPVITLSTYVHLWGDDKDDGCADAIEAVLK